MIHTVKMRIIQVYEFIRSNGWLSFLREVIYINRKAIVVEKNLHEVNDSVDLLQRSDVSFIEITSETFTNNNYRYLLKNRYLKALHYLKKGYIGYAIVRENKIIGDIWHFTSKRGAHLSYHPDIYWLGIKYTENDVYSFDMYIIPDERGNNLSIFLQKEALSSLYRKGYTRAYGFYWADNIPALWVNRTLKWKELKILRLNRFLFFKKVVSESETESIYSS